MREPRLLTTYPRRDAFLVMIAQNPVGPSTLG